MNPEGDGIQTRSHKKSKEQYKQDKKWYQFQPWELWEWRYRNAQVGSIWVPCINAPEWLENKTYRRKLNAPARSCELCKNYNPIYRMCVLEAKIIPWFPNDSLPFRCPIFPNYEPTAKDFAPHQFVPHQNDSINKDVFNQHYRPVLNNVKNLLDALEKILTIADTNTLRKVINDIKNKI